MDLEFHTERLYMRPLELGDLDLCLELFTNPEVTRYAGGVMTPDAVEAGMPSWIRRCADGCIGVWCVLGGETSRKLGSGALLPMPIDEDDTDWSLVHGPDIPDGPIEVGYFLKEAAWGRGLATEICTELIRFAFSATVLEDVVACTDEQNSQSQRVLTKSGLRHEGMRRAYSAPLPFFRISREQWLASC